MIMTKNTLKAAVAILLFSHLISMEAIAQQQSKGKTRIIRKTEIRFLSWFPDDYKSNKKTKYPLLIFLHGSGERGADLDKVKVWGPPSFVEQRPDFPFIVISPQCPEGLWWNIEDLDILLGKLLKKYRIDPDRIYLTGLSMGGFGTWSWACTYPDRFAAIAPVCGGGDNQFADEINNVPVWAFHGQEDPVVPARRTIEMVEAINQNGGNAKMTIYPGVGHDSWKQAYSGGELYNWLLSHTRK
jgi:predicted peptidase